MLSNVDELACHVILQPQMHEASAWTVSGPNLDQDPAPVGQQQPESVSSLPLLGCVRGLGRTLCHVGG